MNQKLAVYNNQLNQLLTQEEFEKLNTLNLIEEICEYLNIVSRLYSRKSDKNGIEIAKIGIELSENSDLPLKSMAHFCFEYAKTVQNYLMFQESARYTEMATFLYTSLSKIDFATECTLFNIRNYLFLSQLNFAQTNLLEVESVIDLTKTSMSIYELKITFNYLQMLYYVCMHNSNITSFNSQSNEILQCIQFNSPKLDWNEEVIDIYISLLTDLITFHIVVEKTDVAKIYLELFEVAYMHPNINQGFKDVAAVTFQLLQFRYEIQTNTATIEKANYMEELYSKLNILVSEKINIHLNFNELLCKYYLKNNDIQHTIKWALNYEKLKIEYEGLYGFEESSHINYYKETANFFVFHGEYVHAINFLNKIPTLHTVAFEEIRNNNLQERKLEKKLQLEVEKSIQLNAKLEAFRERIMFELKQKRILKKRFDSLIRISYTYLSQPEKLSLNEAQKEVSKVKREFEKEWSISNFENSFLELFPNFNSIFSKFAPTISKTEIKVCMALVSGLDIYAIADLFSKESKTIEEYLRRIRRKFQLPKKANLFQFLKECYSIIQK